MQMQTNQRPPTASGSLEGLRSRPRHPIGGRPPVYPRLMRVIGLLLAVGVAWGCGYLKPIEGPEASRGTDAGKPGLKPVYHDFDDILVPKAMRKNRKMTRLTDTPFTMAGVVSFEGNLNREELVRFFSNNMAKDNWTSVDRLIGPRSLLRFEKPNRWCMLTISDRPGGYGCRLEIWVVPKTGASSGLLK